MEKRSEQVHSRESSATLQLTVSLLYQIEHLCLRNGGFNGKIRIDPGDKPGRLNGRIRHEEKCSRDGADCKQQEERR